MEAAREEAGKRVLDIGIAGTLDISISEEEPLDAGITEEAELLNMGIVEVADDGFTLFSISAPILPVFSFTSEMCVNSRILWSRQLIIHSHLKVARYNTSL